MLQLFSSLVLLSSASAAFAQHSILAELAAAHPTSRSEGRAPRLAPEQIPRGRPKIQPTLVVMLDDVPSRLFAFAQTPNMDSLTRLPRFWGAPNSSGARALLESGVWAIDPLNRIGGIFGPNAVGGLEIGRHLLARRIANAAQVGKWHLCAHSDLTHRGRAGYVDYGGPQSNLAASGSSFGSPGHYYDHHVVENGQLVNVQEYATDWQAARALARVQEGRTLVVCAFNAIHTPVQGPLGFAGGTQDETLVAMLEYTDAALGPIFAAARLRGYAIIVANDNGGTVQNGGKGNVSAMALNCWAGFDGFTVKDPMKPCSFVDLHATIIDLCTGAPPGPPARGVSLLRGYPDIVFADHFSGLNADPLPAERWSAATDGVVETIKAYAPAPGDPEWTDSAWDDRPIAPGLTAHLRAAILARE